MELRTILIGVLAVAAAGVSLYMMKDNSSPLKASSAFRAFQAKHSKSYSSPQEVEYRMAIFADNLQYIEQSNAQGKSFELGVNQFSDMTFEEFSKFYLMEPIQNELSDPAYDLPLPTAETKDWVKAGKVSHVKNQARCGSCWAFSTTGSLEAALAIKTGTLNEYSEQELVDCSRAYGNYGCNGGLMTYAFKYIHDKKIAREEDYPYKGVDQKCSIKKQDNRVTVAGFKLLAKNDVATLVNEIRKAPVSVAIEVQRDFMSYKTGIYTNARCGSALNHGVLAAGFVIDDKNNYFIVKNSWGTAWGEQGYIRMAFGTGSGTCGIANSWDAIPVL